MRHLLFVLVLVCCAALTVPAQRKPKGTEGGSAPTPPTTPTTEKTDPFAEKLKGTRAYPGLLTVYQDTAKGTLLLRIAPAQLNKEFIHFSYIENGPVSAGTFRGQFRSNGIITIERYFDRIDFVKQNTAYYFDPSNPLSRAAKANLTDGLLASSKILATDSATGDMLVDASEYFIGQSLTPLKFYSQGTPRWGLGNFNAAKSRVVAIKNYPENTDLVFDYAFENPTPPGGGGGQVADDRSVLVRMQHSLIAVPQNDYKPRFDDPRVGFFLDQTDDQTSPSFVNYRDMITRWHLKKKDPSAAISEPVEPIVYWIENTTPHELRPYIKAAGEAWNIAFEAAGFKNAFIIKEQPDDADWDAGDIRYNVLRWTSSPTPPFGGYGPSFTNPRTGQILGADIMLEWVYVVNRLKYEEVFDQATMTMLTPIEELEAEGIHSFQDHRYCADGHFAMHETAAAKLLLAARGLDETSDEYKRLTKETVYRLILHEIGHTLGLNHNMKASNLHNPANLNNPEVTYAQGMSGSVMDYHALHLAPLGQPQGQYADIAPGPYDIWAIQFGYNPDLDDPTKMKAHLARSTEPALVFGNDADDMRSPGKAIDPRVNTGDHSSDAIGYAQARIELMRATQSKLIERSVKAGATYQELLLSFNIMLSDVARQAAVTSRFVGGVYVNRAHAGQAGGTPPYTPVPKAEQKRAMQLLATYVFAPNVLQVDETLFRHLAPQRRGYNFSGTTEDPKLHDQVLAMQAGVLAHLLHPRVTQRLTDASKYGNTYSLSEMMNDLTAAIFTADIGGTVNTFRQNLQIAYVNALLEGGGYTGKDSPYDNLTQREIFTQLTAIDALLARNPGTGDTANHRKYIRFLIEKGLDD